MLTACIARRQPPLISSVAALGTTIPMSHSIHYSVCLALFALSGCAGHSHYAGMQSREIKALSADDIAGLRAGRGMSMALAAELNGYPGPLHVLELADRLSLSEAQRQETRALYERMRSTAVSAGEALIARERELDALFVGKSATPAALTAALVRVAEAQARVRDAHLQAHLEQVRILSPEQIAVYKRLRGYRT
jgi:Spy/CpxP family protein refolding chaperone